MAEISADGGASGSYSGVILFARKTVEFLLSAASYLGSTIVAQRTVLSSGLSVGYSKWTIGRPVQRSGREKFLSPAPLYNKMIIGTQGVGLFTSNRENLLELKTIEHHDLIPRSYEVVDKLPMGIVARVDLG